MDLPQQRLFSNKSLVTLIVPIMLERVLALLVGLVDSLMVSSVGQAAISGVSLVVNISSMLLNLTSALAAGGGIVASQFIGAGKKVDAKRAAGHLMTMTVGTSVLVMILCLIFNRQLLQLFFGRVEADVMEASVVYFFYIATSFPFLALYDAGAVILRANGNSKVSFYVSLLRNAVNIVGNAICIYGLGMGVEGVAIPTAISRVVGAVSIMLVVFSKKQAFRPSWKDIIHIRPKLMGSMVRVGLPTGVENSLFQLGRLLTLSMISGFGTYQIVANSSAAGLCNVVVSIIGSFRLASMTVIGQCVGARDEQQIRENYRKLMIGGYVVHGVAAVLFVIFRYPLIGLYDSLEPAAIDMTAKLMCIHLLPAIVLYAPSFMVSGPLRAANDSAFVMWVSILSMAVFRLTLAQILCVELGWGAIGIWCAMVVDWVCRSICFLLRWHIGSWKKKCGLCKA